VSRIAILGGGGWGTALAIVLSRARRKHDISLWVHDPRLESSGVIAKTAIICRGIACSLKLTLPRYTHAISGAQNSYRRDTDRARACVYSSAIGELFAGCRFRKRRQRLEPATHKRMSEVVAAVVSSKSTPPFAALQDHPLRRKSREASQPQSCSRPKTPPLARNCGKSSPRLTSAYTPMMMCWALKLAAAMKN